MQTRAKHTVKVQSCKEYKEALDAAETLGLELAKATTTQYGWDVPDNAPYDTIHPGRQFDIDKVGRKYVHFDFGSEGKARGEFGYDSINDEPAYLKLQFK